MRDIEDCLDEIQDDTYAYTTTRNEFVDADLDESTTKAMCNAYVLKDDASLLIFAKSHVQAILDAMNGRAQHLANKPSPLAVHFDEVDAGLDRLTIRSAA